MTARATSRNSSRPRAAHSDTTSAYAALSAVLARYQQAMLDSSADDMADLYAVVAALSQ
ncbi:hypothetical protein [Streptomyces sp. NPDC058694]|uniref:hypothetical protein n=1 Tax=Streptomyces sp. NPDC058694 TaxID=3346603 RepID=UPI0036495FFF